MENRTVVEDKNSLKKLGKLIEDMKSILEDTKANIENILVNIDISNYDKKVSNE